VGEAQGRKIAGAGTEQTFTAGGLPASSPTRSRGALRRQPWLLALPSAAVLGVVFLAPLGVFTVYAFFKTELFGVTHTFTLGNFRAVLSDALWRDLLWNSLLVGFLTALLSLALGLPVAYFARYRAGRFGYVVLLLLVLGMFTSYLARIFAWQAMLSNSGILNDALTSVGLPKANLLFTKWAVLLTLLHIYIPYVAVTAYAAMRNLPRDLLDISADLGAKPLATWRKVLLPLLAAPMAAPFLFTFVLAASDFAIPQIMGGKAGNMIGSYIQQTFSDAGNYPLGAAMSLLLLLSFLGVYLLVAIFLRVTRLHRIPAVY
jgi:spermidine/putrescine transport system permease protein